VKSQKFKLIHFILVISLISLMFAELIQATSSSIIQSSSLPDYSEAVNAINMTSIRKHIEYFSSLGSRVTLYPGYEKAANYIYNWFVDTGLTSVSYHLYNITVPIDYGAYMEVITPEHANITLYPFWPNMVSLSQTPPEGFKGNLVYVGEGYLHDLDGKKIKDNIVLMKFNSQMNWLNVAKFGAKAVIFIEPIETSNDEAQAKILDYVSLYFPRLYIRREDANYLLSLLEKNNNIAVKVVSKMRFEKRSAKNIMGYVEGTTYKDQYVVFSSYYDSFSYIPSLSPGAREASGISVLLEMAKYYAKHPAKYTILFIAFSGLNEGICGARWWVKHNVDQNPSFGTRIVLMLDMNLDPDGTMLVPTWTGHYLSLGEASAPWSPELFKYLMQTVFPEVQNKLGPYDISKRGLSQTFVLVGAEPTIMGHEGNYYFMMNNEALSNIGGPGTAWMSGGTWRRYFGTPLDTADRIKYYKNLETQIEYIWAVWHILANTENLRPNILPPWKPTYVRDVGPKWADILGRVAEYDYEKAWYKPVPNAILLCRNTGGGYIVPTMRFEGLWTYDIVAEDGSFLFPGAGDEYRGTGWWELYAFKLNETTGEIIYAPDSGKYWFMGMHFAVIRAAHPWNVGIVTVMPCHVLTVYDTVDPNYLNNAKDNSLIFSIFDFQSHAAPDSFGFQLGVFGAYGHGVSNFFVTPETSVEVTMRASYAMRYPLGILTNSSEEYPTGVGYTSQKSQKTVLNILDLVRDLYWLNEARLRTALRSGVGGFAKQEHDRTYEMLLKAVDALDDYQYSEAYALLSKAWGSERNIYVKLRSSIEDTVSTVPYFALTLVLFAFLAERLLFDFDGIKRLSVLLMCYIVPVILLWLVHPGFLLSADATMVLISFVILILISPILLLLLGQISEAITYVRRKTLGVHEAGVSKMDSAIISFGFSLKVMRSRRFRTGLELTSIILVVAALVSFTSISAITKVAEAPSVGQAAYDGVHIHQEEWAHTRTGVHSLTGIFPGLGQNLVEVIEKQYSSVAAIVPRAWRYGVFNPSNQEFILYNPSTGGSINVFGLLGLTPEETEVSPVNSSLIEGRLFINSDEETEREVFPCIISNSAAQKLDVKIGETLRLYSLNLTVIGIADDNALSSINDLDQESITPLYTGVPAWNVHLPPFQTLILPYKVVMSLGGWVMSVSIKFHDPDLVLPAARKLYEQIGITIVAGCKGALYVYTQKDVITIMGWQFQIIPMILVVLTLFNIIFASIYERVNEINILSTVGLNPLNISAIFISESLTLAIIGALIGYLSAMLTSLILIQMNFPVTLNYSSSWVFTAVGISILATVLASLYPSLRASRLVTPSLERRWTIPTPKGNHWEIPLPFTAIDQEIDGLIEYIREMINAHSSDESEIFYLRSPSRLTEGEEEKLTLKTLILDVALEPYEAGVRQDAKLMAIKNKGEDRYRFTIICDRREGSFSIWTTRNRSFIDLLRKQFLLWRSLAPSERSRYVKEK